MQIAIGSKMLKHSSTAPYAFSEHGVLFRHLSEKSHTVRAATARAVLLAFFKPTVKTVVNKTEYILSDFFPQRASQARFVSFQILKMSGIKQTKSETVFVRVFFFEKGRIFLTACSIAPTPPRISSGVEVLNRIDALCIRQKIFSRRTAEDAFENDRTAAFFAATAKFRAGKETISSKKCAAKAVR